MAKKSENNHGKVLLIEDDPDQRYLYQTQFELDEIPVETAANGPEGIEKANQGTYSLILLDMVMDQMDGMTVLKKLKSDASTKNIPVVILTNLAKKDLIAESKASGAADFWSKTDVLPKDIVQRAKKYLK